MNDTIRLSLTGYITERATDEEVARFAQEVIERVKHVQSVTTEIARYIGINPISGKKNVAPPAPALAPETPTASVPVAAAPDKNVNPGRSTITRMGQDTAANLISSIGAGTQPAEKFSEHLKLLWARNQITYDGKEYHLP